MLDGVQGVGKSTILQHLFSKQTLINNREIKLLKRTQELNSLLTKAPAILYQLDTKSYVGLVKEILVQWRHTINKVPLNSDSIWILDRGPITTLSYQSMVLDYITRDDRHYQHFASKYTRALGVPSKMYLDSLFGTIQSILYNFFKYTFAFYALGRQQKVVGIHIKSSPQIIEDRFAHRTEDIRANNMQDWFTRKSDEIDTYDRSYKLVRKWLSPDDGFNNLTLDSYNNDTTVENGVADLIKMIRRYQ